MFDNYGDEVGNKLGRNNGYVEHGNLGSIHIKHERQSIYSLINVPKSKNYDSYRPGDHQVCIGWGSNVMDPGRGSNQYIFTGDIGAICGAYWHWSGIHITDENDYQPKCFWLGYCTLGIGYYAGTLILSC